MNPEIAYLGNYFKDMVINLYQDPYDTNTQSGLKTLMGWISLITDEITWIHHICFLTPAVGIILVLHSDHSFFFFVNI